MTLGIAYADDKAIYLAIEHCGLPAIGPREFGLQSSQIGSKAIVLQRNPEVAVLLAGGLTHWAYVINKYLPQKAVYEAAAELARLLDQCMQEHNCAFGLVCGYEKGNPACFRVERDVNNKHTEICQGEIKNQPQFVGSNVSDPAGSVDSKILNGSRPPDAIMTTIRDRLDGKILVGPIDEMVIRKGN